MTFAFIVLKWEAGRTGLEAFSGPVQNVIDAATRGAGDGLNLALNVGAMLLAFIALIALINGMLGGVGAWFVFESLTLEGILGALFSPLAFAIGVP